MNKVSLIFIGAAIVLYNVVIRVAVFIAAIFAIMVFWQAISSKITAMYEHRQQPDVRSTPFRPVASR